MGAMKCLDCGKEIVEKPCKYCGSGKAPIEIIAGDVISVAEITHTEPIIEVVATPTGQKPIKSEYPILFASADISAATVPLVTDNPEEKCPLVEKSLDLLKDHFEAGKHSIVLRITEEEEVDKGWFSHTDLSGGYSFEKGDINFKVKGTPKKIKRKKETTIEVGLKEKDK